jgi:glycosyltransferase involved in cell wall biosynthesis
VTGDSPLVSVIVPVRHAEDALPDFLGCLERQTLPRERFEVVVVDDASRDRTAEVARAAGIASVLVLPAWGGAYAARNAGLRQARGEIVAFTDVDCRPEPAWLEHAVEELERNGADLLGGHIEVPLGSRPTIAELVDFARYLDQERGLEEGGFAVTANLIARRRVVDAIGPFIENVISDGDREWCLRATEAGFRLAYGPSAVVHHEPRRRIRDVARRGFRDGYGLAQMRVHGGRHAERVRRIWAHPGAYVPGRIIRRTRDVYGIERIHAAGYRVGRQQLFAMQLGEWLFVQLPLVAGNITGSLRESIGVRRRGSRTKKV